MGDDNDMCVLYKLYSCQMSQVQVNGMKTHSTNIVFIYCIFDFILQTLPDSHESYVLYGSTQAEFCTSQN